MQLLQPVCLEPVLHKRRHCRKKPTHCRAAPACHSQRKPTQSKGDPDKNKNIYLNIPTKQEQIHRHREQTRVCQGGGGGRGKDWACGISRCKLLQTESGSILLLGTYLGKTLIQKDTCHPYAHKGTIYNSQDMQAT